MGSSIFEIIGPIMVGPSSSHTAGMARIGLMARRIIGERPQSIRLELSPKLRTTYKGHRTDAALVGGVMGLDEYSPKLKESLDIAAAQGIHLVTDFLPEGEYPQNTARITVTDDKGSVHTVAGTSVGGGSVVISEIDRAEIILSADAHHIICWSGHEINWSGITDAASVQVRRGGRSVINCFTFSQKPDREVLRRIRQEKSVTKVSEIAPVLRYGVSREGHPVYSSCEEVCLRAAREKRSLSELSVEYEMERGGCCREEIIERMYLHFEQMRSSIECGKKENHLLYGLASGNDAAMLYKAAASGKTVSGGIIPEAVAMALGVMEYNGSMGCVVAAPTAGSSGIIPACMEAVRKYHHIPKQKIIDALFVSALLGVVMLERNVSFSGSVGGCQGEVGVSGALAAAGVASIFSDEPEVSMHAMAICLKNMLGLVCDPIAEPIEVPCIKRNAAGVANAFISADMALAGIRSFIPPDEVIDALADVEKRMPQELKCATIGGLACTCTAKSVRKKLKKEG